MLVLALQFPQTQNYLTHKAADYLSAKLKTKVEVGEINLSFPKSLSLKNIFVEDQAKDTLLYCHALDIDVDLLALLSKKIHVNSVSVERATARISRTKGDSLFNFSFIPAAFSSPADTVKPPKPAGQPWAFTLGKLDLKDISFSWHDSEGGIRAYLQLGSLEAGLDVFDLPARKIHFEEISLKNTRAQLNQTAVPEKASSDVPGPAFDIGLSRLRLDEIGFGYGSEGLTLESVVGKLRLEADKIDLGHQQIALNSIDLSDSHLFCTLHPAKDIAKAQPQAEGAGWTLSLKTLDLIRSAFTLDDPGKPVKTGGMDFAHLSVLHIGVHAEEIYVSPERITANLHQAELEEKSGFSLRKLATRFSYDSTRIELADLNIETAGSRIRNYLSLSYPSKAALQGPVEDLLFKADLYNAQLSLEDLRIFQPELFDQSVLKKGGPEIHLNTRLEGSLKALQVQHFELSAGSHTALRFKGLMRNVQHSENLYAEVELQELSVDREELDRLLSENLIPQQIQIPVNAQATGYFTGYLRNFNAGLDLETPTGRVTGRMRMNPLAGNRDQDYALDLNLNNFNAGALLRQKPGTLGRVTLTAGLTGHGIRPDSLNGMLDLCLDSASVKTYTYKNLSVNGAILKKSFTGAAHIDDHNLAFDFRGHIDLDTSHTCYAGQLNLEGADLGALHLTHDDLRLSALIVSDLEAKRGKNMTGTVRLLNGLVIKDNVRHPIDSLVLSSAYAKDMADIRIRSSFLNADFKGNLLLARLPDLLEQQLDGYFNLRLQPDTLFLSPQKFEFSLSLSDHSGLSRIFFPELKKLSPSFVTGEYDSRARHIRLDLRVPEIQYGSVKMDSLKLRINSDAEQLSCRMNLGEVADSLYEMENIGLSGTASHNRLLFGFQTSKDDSSKMIALSGVLNNRPPGYELHLNKTVVLNKTNWTVDTANRVLFGTQVFQVQKLLLTDGPQIISVGSLDKSAQAPLDIRFSNFDVATLSKIIERDKPLVRGTLDGTIQIKDQNKKAAFSSDISLKDFALFGNPVGTVTLHTDNESASGQYALRLKITGNGNDLSMDGNYTAGVSDNNLAFILDARSLNLKTVEPFTFGQFSRMSGSLHGVLNIRGKASAPVLDGSLALKDCGLKPRLIDSYLRIPEGTIAFPPGKIQLSNFTLLDSLGNKAVLNGYADVRDPSNLQYDLRMKTKNFLALNTTQWDNPLYFGKAWLDSDLHLTGNLDAPVIDAKVRLNKGTSITYIKPEDQGVGEESKGIVEFNEHLQELSGIMARKEAVALKPNKASRLTLRATIEIDKSTKLKMVVDPVSGDSLIAIGAAQLAFTLDPDGKTTLNGRYKLYGGSYHLAINELIQRNFKIEPGSLITWSGDVTDAYFDLRAIYSVRTAPLDLMENQLAGMNDMQKSAFRTNMNFQVYLKMRGSLTSPEISFDIRLPQDQAGAMNGVVATRLDQLRSDENEMNKQVFALLAMNRFLAEDPLDNSGGGSTVSSTARSSGSKLLTDRLNSLSGKYIKAVDLNLGLESYDDYSTGQQQGRTQLQVGVTKQLFKDKVSVKIGGSVDVEGEKARQNNASDVAGNIDIEYKLTPDETYKLKGFRKTEYTNPIEGEVTKTGAGILFTKDFNKFKELFRKTEKTETTIE